jgi:glycosyltransferase involved in cell wall biosynthesis/predicted O-methyltransferase YrrM
MKRLAPQVEVDATHRVCQQDDDAREAPWRPLPRRSLDAVHQGQFAQGIEACHALLNDIGVPGDIRELAYRYQTSYARPLHEMVPGSSWHPLDVPLPAGWSARDPSPVVDGDRLLVLVRAEQGSAARTAAALAPTDASGEIEFVVLRDLRHECARLTEMRPFVADGIVQVAFVAREPGDGLQDRPGVAVLDGEDLRDLRLLDLRPRDFGRGWSPAATGDGPRFVAWWEPMEVFRFDAASADFAPTALHAAPHLAERFRGGSQGISVPGGHLFLVNEAVDMGDGNWLTYNRFVRVDRGFRITDVSPQFFVAERGQDAATGLARQEGRLVTGFSSAGRGPILATLDLAGALATLLPVHPSMGASTAVCADPAKLKLIGICVVRNEADVVRLSILHHLALGLDQVLVIDNGSTDDTVEVLERLSREDPRVHWRSEPGQFHQVELRTGLAREAFALGADWVAPFDADEFWWAEGGDLRAVLAATRAGALRAWVVNFVQDHARAVASAEGLLTMTRRPARPIGDSRNWAESRDQAQDREIAYVEMLYRPKWISRPTAEIEIGPGNHRVSGVAGPNAEARGLAVLHAPLRSRACLERKADYGERALRRGGSPNESWHLKRWAGLRESGALDREWAANSYAGAALDVYGTEHPLVVDHRLRDAVRPFLPHVQEVPAMDPQAGLSDRFRYPSQLKVPCPNLGTVEFLASTSSRIIAEVGVYKGLTSRKIAEHLNGEGELHLFDFADLVDPVVAELQAAGYSNVVGHGNSRKVLDSYNWSLMRLLQEHAAPIFDYAFLDGAHVWAFDALAFVLIDRLLKPGGYVDFDDYGWSLAVSPSLKPSVFPATAELYTEEQVAAKQVALVVDLLVRRDDRYVEVVRDKIFQKTKA